MKVLNLTAENFESEIKTAQSPVIVDFWATWCGPCKMLTPILEEIAQENCGTVKVCKVNVDEQPVLAAKFGIMSIPTMIFYKDNIETGKLVGLRSKDEILSKVL